MRILLAAAALATARAAPCDILAAAGTPCAAAHSTTRSLFASFFSPLYQLKRFGDNATLDVLPLAPGGFTNASSHDAFCAANPAPPPPPPPPPPPSGLPPLGTRVLLQPAALPGFALRHCYSQGFVTPAADSGDDHAFTLRAALSGAAGAVSFQSVNFPAQWLAPMPGDAGRVGIVAAPEAGGASWAVAPAPGGGVTLIGGGGALVPGRNLTGTCAHSYAAPSASANVAPAGAGAAVWAVLPDAQGPSYPPRAACVISILYDQTGNRNHLLPASPAINNPAYDNPVNATRHPLRIGGGVKVYGAFFEGGMGYRARNTTAVARGNAPETLYMVTSGTHVNDGCCMDYGSSENDADNPGAFCDGCMEAIYIGTGGGWCGGGGNEAHVLADLENGLWGCDTPGGSNPNNTALPFEFVTAMVKGGTNGFALKGGDATQGALKTMWDGPRPPGYSPMHKTGAIILGVGGDNVSRKRVGGGIPGTSVGTFYEGVLTVGYTSDAVDEAVQADIRAAGYAVFSG